MSTKTKAEIIFEFIEEDNKKKTSNSKKSSMKKYLKGKHRSKLPTHASNSRTSARWQRSVSEFTQKPPAQETDMRVCASFSHTGKHSTFLFVFCTS